MPVFLTIYKPSPSKPAQRWTAFFLWQYDSASKSVRLLNNTLILICRNLNSNPLTGTIPTTIGQLTALTNLLSLCLSNSNTARYLQSCQLTDYIPSQLAFMTSLHELYYSIHSLSHAERYLNSNSLVGTLPDMTNLTGMQDM